MTERVAYESVLRELRKVKAPHVHLEDFNYYFNKGVQEFINEQYNIFETTQQTTDALSCITSFVEFLFIPNNRISISGNSIVSVPSISYIQGSRYNSKFVQVNLPADYMHLLNCVTDVKANFNYKCHAAGYIHSLGSRKLNADSAANVIDNAWLKPDFKRTFYKMLDHANTGISLNNITAATNTVLTPDIQVYYGNNPKFSVDKIFIEYLRKPKIVNLTDRQVDLVNDTSAPIDFTDYICAEIIKRVVKLLLENSKDPRLAQFVPVNQSIK